jgi:hypothetical protein
MQSPLETVKLLYCELKPKCLLLGPDGPSDSCSASQTASECAFGGTGKTVAAYGANRTIFSLRKKLVYLVQQIPC